MSYRIGVDIGGTFADFCALDEATGRLATLKVLSTPQEPGREVIAGLAELGSRFGIQPQDIGYFTHGTTVGINSVIQRKGIRLCLFTTENFVDVLELARLKMPDPYHLMSRRAEPLVTRDRVLPVRERMLADGTVDRPLDPASLRRALDQAIALGAEGIVLALLHSYRNPAHEREAQRLIGQWAPQMPVFCSSDVWPIIREYERTATATIHGYVQPVVARYLAALQTALKQAGVAAEAMVTKSNGGVMTAELGKSACLQMLLSGTAAGVIGAGFVARQAGLDKVLSLDIGGTSADVAIIVDGTPTYGSGEMVGDFPIYIPTVSVTSIGDGGGSIAAVSEFGILSVGPESAGSTPGPACYGRGGTRPTMTDAFAVCGVIGHGNIGYDAVAVDVEKARAAVGTVAAKLGRGLEQAAEAIIQVAVSGMYREVGKLASRQGIDPRDFTLLAFGGAGPMLGCFLARELGMRQVLIPTAPGVLSALGGLVADVKNDFISTAYYPLSAAELPRLKADFDQSRAPRHRLDHRRAEVRRSLRAAARRRHALSGAIVRDRGAAAARLDRGGRLAAHRRGLPCAARPPLRPQLRRGADLPGQPAHGGGGHLAAAAVSGAAAAQRLARARQADRGLPRRRLAYRAALPAGRPGTRASSRQPLRRGAGGYDDLRAGRLHRRGRRVRQHSPVAGP